jgi:hypothetical protein
MMPDRGGRLYGRVSSPAETERSINGVFYRAFTDFAERIVLSTKTGEMG